MKKVVALLIALMLCLTAVAFAEAVPSKTTGDMTAFKVAGENVPADAKFAIGAAAANELSAAEVANLKAKGVAAYFGEDVELDADATVNEFCPFVASNYEEAYGNVKATMQFPTPYTAGEKVVVLIGLVTENTDGTQSIEWVAYEGVGVGSEGAIEVELDAAIIVAAQNGTALMAVASK